MNLTFGFFFLRNVGADFDRVTVYRDLEMVNFCVRAVRHRGSVAVLGAVTVVFLARVYRHLYGPDWNAFEVVLRRFVYVRRRVVV